MPNDIERFNTLLTTREYSKLVGLVDTFYVECVENVSGKRYDILHFISHLDPQQQSSLFLIILENTEGYNRASWFPQLFVDLRPIFLADGEMKRWEIFSTIMYSDLQLLPDQTTWMPPEVKNAIIRDITHYVDIDFRALKSGAVISYPETSAAGY